MDDKRIQNAGCGKRGFLLGTVTRSIAACMDNDRPFSRDRAPRSGRRSAHCAINDTARPNNARPGQFFIVAALVFCGLSTDALAADITLRERVIPQASVIRLGDIAEIKTADRQEARRLAAVPLMPAPAPGTQQFLRKREVADMLEASGIELKDIHFSGAEQVALASRASVQTAQFEQTANKNETPANRHAAILAGVAVPNAGEQVSVAKTDELNTLVRQVIGDYAKSLTDRADVNRIECKLSERQLARLSAATSSPVCSGGNEPWTGRQEFTLSFTTAAGKEQLTVHADIGQAAVPVVVAIRPVPRGNVVTAADVEVRMLDTATKSANKRIVFDTVDAVIGKEARQALQPDSIVYTDLIQSPILVKRGEVIAVGAASGGIRVRTSAKAVQDGSHGDLIQVETLDSKQKFDVRVVGLREAAVYSPTPVEAPPRKNRTETARRVPTTSR